MLSPLALRAETPPTIPATPLAGMMPLLVPTGEEDAILALEGDPAPVRTATVPLKVDIAAGTVAPPPPGHVEFRRFQHLRWTPGKNAFRAQGNVLAVYTEPDTKKQTTLTAETVTYDGDTGFFIATGGLRLEREEGTFTGQDLQYNFQTGVGNVTNGYFVGPAFRMSGRSIATRENGDYVIQNGTFTTCIRGRPDYRLRARELTISPGRSVSAKGVTFYLGGTPIITLPSYKRNLKASASVPVPVPGYNGTDGLYAGLRTNFMDQPHRTLGLDVRVGTKRGPTGFVSYETDLRNLTPNPVPPHSVENRLSDPLRGILEQLSPPTYREYAENRFEDEYAPRATAAVTLQASQYTYNRRVNDLRVSRFPELSLNFVNLLSRPFTNILTGAHEPARAGFERFPNAPFLLNLNLSVADINERPDNVTAGRFSGRLSVATQPLLIGRQISLRAGFSNWFNLYTSGTIYDLFAPEVELDYAPTRTSRFVVAYRNLKEEGRTPFLFDRRDIRHELRLTYQVSGPWAFGITSKIDLERSRAYDGELALVRNFDCMSAGIAYRVRSQSVALIFSILPPTANRAERLRMPLDKNKTEATPAPVPTAAK